MMNESPSYYRYVSAHSRATIVKALLIAGAVVSVLSMIVAALELAFPPVTGQEEMGENVGGFAVALLTLGIGLLTLAVFVATVVFFLMWLYRSYKNLPAFGARRTSYSPGWAVGSFFVPFANLVIPYRAVKELWQNSVAGETFSFASANPPTWFPLWWGFWIASNIASNIYFRLSYNEKATREAIAIAGVASDALTIIAALLAIMVIGEIDKRQEEASRSLALPQFPSPPMPPPPFGTR
jgi:Domain of unknown function (DUF4328)